MTQKSIDCDISEMFSKGERQFLTVWGGLAWTDKMAAAQPDVAFEMAEAATSISRVGQSR